MCISMITCQILHQTLSLFSILLLLNTKEFFDTQPVTNDSRMLPQNMPSEKEEVKECSDFPFYLKAWEKTVWMIPTLPQRKATFFLITRGMRSKLKHHTNRPCWNGLLGQVFSLVVKVSVGDQHSTSWQIGIWLQAQLLVPTSCYKGPQGSPDNLNSGAPATHVG